MNDQLPVFSPAAFDHLNSASISSDPDQYAPMSGDQSHISTPSLTPGVGPVRKQNVACDACRAKKVRCQRTSVNERCAQCTAKDGHCTSDFIEKQLHKVKKPRKRGGDQAAHKRRRQNLEGNSTGEDEDETRQVLEAVTIPEPDMGHGHLGGNGTSVSTSISWGETSRAGRERYYENNAIRGISDLRHSERQADLVRYLLAPRAVTHHRWGYTDCSSMEVCSKGLSDLWEEDQGRVWREDPGDAHLGLTESAARELSDDAVETFFAIAHPRFPVFDPKALRARLAAPDTHPDGPVPHHLLAVMIAFGARFTDQSIITADREEFTARDEVDFGKYERPPRSRLVQMVVIRAREVLEMQKTHRVRTLVNAQVLVLAESLLGQVAFMGEGETKFEKSVGHSFAAAVKHIIALKYDCPKSLLAIKDEKEKTAAVFTWWLVCIIDGFRAVFYRTPSHLFEANHTAPGWSDVDSLGAPDQYQGEQAVFWFSAASAGSAMCRKLATELWNTRTRQSGLPLSALRDFIHACSIWRDHYLSKLGVPDKWPDSWDFLAAITACSTDAYYHTLWLVVDRAIKDYGIAEERAQEKGEKVFLSPAVASVRKRIRDEAEHGALRITALISVLTLNQYFRLDPLILHHAIYEAGLYLADQGRMECQACVAGLRQYSIPYPQFWGQAREIERVYRDRTASSCLGSTSNVSRASSSTPGENLGTRYFPSPIGPNRANVLAGNGYKALPDVKSEEGDMDVSFALFEWLHQS